jgi:hypothetical protein
MIKNILYKDNGSIDLNIDNTELLPERADIDNSGKTPELLDFGEVGGIPGKEEDKEKNDAVRDIGDDPTRHIAEHHVKK